MVKKAEQPVFARVVAGHVALASAHMGERVDAEGGVIDRDRAPEEPDHQAGPAADSQTDRARADRRASS